MQRRAFLFGAPLVLAGCTTPPVVFAPQSAVNAVRVAGSAQKSLTLYTMRSVGTTNGAHSSLLIDASERVLFDPAGSFENTVIPERHDVLFGMTPRIEDFYVSYHARASFYVQKQRIVVPAATAERALQLALRNGPVANGLCARATSTLLSQLPDFETIRPTYLPSNLADRFATISGVIENEFRETDSDDNAEALAQIDAALNPR